MKIIYIICAVTFVKLIHSVYKRIPENIKEIQNHSNFGVEIIDIDSVLEIPAKIPKVTLNEETAEKPSGLGKNKWLNQTDNFGKMEKGREL